MNAGRVFTEKYLKLMFKQLRDATPDEVMEELEHCRRENLRTVRIPRYFRNYFISESIVTSSGYEMQYFLHKETRPLSPKFFEDAYGQRTRKLILYLHGGAFIYPPVFFHWRFMHDLGLRSHCDIIMPIYPKSPEYTCIDTVSNLLEFYHQVVENLDDDEIHFIGDSAGAHLCLVLAQEAAQRGWRKADSITLLSPCVDLSHTKEKEMRALQDKDPMLQLDRVVILNAVWQGNLPATHPWVSPVFGDFTGLDNLSVYYGSNEILKPDAMFLQETYEKARKQGLFKEYEGMFHTFPLFPIPEGFEVVREMAKKLKLDSTN